MKLSELISELIKDADVISVAGDTNIDISNIAYHTKDVSKGSCFVAIAGGKADGHDFAVKAAESGASAVVASRKVNMPEGVVLVIVEETRRALSAMSARFFGEPSKGMTLVGVTGTNGKTTVTYLVESIWKLSGFETGVIGTVGYRWGGVERTASHTTPESHDLQKLLNEMRSDGVTHAVMEVSSHSLDQGRACGCHFDGAIFTNLTQDHLDYHLDMERYRTAKERIFTEMLPASAKPGVFAVVNIDDRAGADIARKASCSKVVTYSLLKRADVSADDASFSMDGMKLVCLAGGKRTALSSPLIGRHNAGNVMAAFASAFAMGIDEALVKKGIEEVRRIPGRLEKVENKKGLTVFVDYAHTPDAIRNVTAALKELQPRRLITVFGCGGDRDKAKRPLMGFSASVGSDMVIVTSDNPRVEDPGKIIEEIVSGVKKAGGCIVEPDRKKAIEKALSIALPGDIVLVAGKGHEKYQIIGNERVDFDDCEIVRGVG